MSFENLSVETRFLDVQAFVEVPSIVDILPSSLTTFSINEHFCIVYNIIYNLYMIQLIRYFVISRLIINIPMD